MRIGEMDFFGIPVMNRDFSGNKFGPDYRSFSVPIDDPAVEEKLRRDGMELWYSKNPNNNADDARPNMNIKVDNRFGDVKIVVVATDGSAVRLHDQNFGDLDKLWIKGADIHVVLNQYAKRTGGVGVTAYLKTMVAHLMSEEEQEAIKAERASSADGVMAKYSNLFKE